MTVARPNQSTPTASHPPIESNLSRNGMAASANQFVSQTAMAVLRNGGNAIDAAVAAAAVLMTVEPRNGHLGADTFFLINLAVVVWLLWRKRLFGLNGGGAAEAAERARDVSWEEIERRTLATPVPDPVPAGEVTA